MSLFYIHVFIVGMSVILCNCQLGFSVLKMPGLDPDGVFKSQGMRLQCNFHYIDTLQEYSLVSTEETEMESI